VLVGDIDTEQAIELAEQYFGRIPRGETPPPPMITMEPQQLAEKRFYGAAETNPAVTARWHTVATVHRDTPALMVLAEILNGPTGRLQRKLVLEQGIATDAYAHQDARKYEGMFEIEADCKEGHTPEELEQAIHAEIAALQQTVVEPAELQSVKNRYLTRTYRRLDGNFFQMIRYGIAEAQGSWQDAERIDQAIQAVTAEDIQQVAQKYFDQANRAVAIWTRSEGAEPEDPALAALPPQAKQMVKQSLARLDAMTTAAEVQGMLGRIEGMGNQIPAEMQPALDYMRDKAQEKLTALEGQND